jgi:hypothetical protein
MINSAVAEMGAAAKLDRRTQTDSSQSQLHTSCALDYLVVVDSRTGVKSGRPGMLAAYWQ